MPEIGNTSVFSQTDASNNGATMPGWNGAAAPSTIDDSGRALQGAITRDWNWRNYTVTSSGSANAYVLTYSVAPAAYYTGSRFAFVTNFAVTGSATVNVNTLGAKTIKKDVAGVLTALSSGDIATGQYIDLVYNGTDMIWVNWQGAASPAFTGGTLTATTSMTSKPFNEAKGAAVASAGTTDIWTPADGNYIHITGTTTITSLGTAPQAGAERTIIFDGILTLTHNATTLVLPGGVNITTAANDRMIVRADTTANMIVINYIKASGLPVVTPTTLTVIRKATADARASTTLTNDTDFTFSMLANTNYLIKGRYYVTTAASTTGAKVGLSGPASPTSVLFTSTFSTASSGVTITAPFAVVSTSGSGVASYVQTAGIGAPDEHILDFEVVWRNGANAGTFVLQTARQGATNTATFKLDSELSYVVF